MVAPDLVVRSRRVVSERGTRAAAIHIKNGKIVGVLDFDDVPSGCPVDDVGDAAVLPGVVDIQVTASADAVTGTAGAGGVTTIVEAGACATRILHAQDEAIAALRDAGQAFRTPTHILNLSSSDALAPLFHARAARLPVTAGTCPHYLYFAAEELPGWRARFRVTPSVPGRANRELLCAAVAHGLVHAVSSGGSTPVELSLPVTWTVAHGRGCTLDQLAQWMCRAPALIAGLTRKGRIDVGYDADLVVFWSDTEFTVKRWGNDRHALPYVGRHLRGVVGRTYLRGVCRVFTQDSSGHC
jgi:allantoinase